MKLMDQIRRHMRTSHFAIRTEKAYLAWIKRFLQFHRGANGDWLHPNEMGSNEVNEYLSYLAVEGKVSASTQNQALSALLMLFREILDNDGLSIDAIRAKHPDKLPVVLSQEEVMRVLSRVAFGPRRIVVGLQYGCGLRLLESCRLRVKDIDFDRRQIIVRDGKGDKDRAVPLPSKLLDGLRRQIKQVRTLHAGDLDEGAGWVWLPNALARKYPSAGRTLPWLTCPSIVSARATNTDICLSA